MLQPSFSPDLSPLPDYVGVDESQITLSRHVREVGFYGGTIGINSETHTMFPLSVVALAAAGTSLEQVKDWYGADPESARSQAIDNAYERLGMTTPEGVQARVANTWRSGQLYVARQVRLPHRSSPKVRRLPEDPLTVLGGLSMGVDSEKLGAWAAERNTS